MEKEERNLSTTGGFELIGTSELGKVMAFLLNLRSHRPSMMPFTGYALGSTS